MNDIEILVPEFDRPPKGILWYMVALTASIIFGFAAYFLKNYTFIGILLLFWIIVIARDARPPTLVSLLIDNRGISLGNKLWEYKDLKEFSIFSVGDKNYLIFTPIGKFQLNIKVPIKNTEEIKSKLTNSLTEVEYQEPLIEGLARILRM